MTELLQMQPQPKLHFIEAWFLIPGRLDVCVRSRRLQVHCHMDMISMQHMCFDLWADVLDVRLDVTFQRVVPNPSTSRATRAHVIIMQSQARIAQGILVRCESWTTVEKHRAVMAR